MQTILMGQETDNSWGKRLIDQSFSGEITLFNLWNSELSQEDIEELYSCSSIAKVIIAKVHLIS